MTTTPATERGSSKNYSTDVVVDPAEAEAIRQSLYRTDAAAVGQILPSFNPHLSAADLEHFRVHGYLAMNGLLTSDEIEGCKTALGDLAHRRIAWDKRVWSQEEPYFAQGGQDARADDPELRLRKLAFFVHLEPRLRHVSTHPRLRAVIDALIGPGSRMIQDMALLKPPFRGSEKPWHQDAAYFDWTPLGGVSWAPGSRWTKRRSTTAACRSSPARTCTVRRHTFTCATVSLPISGYRWGRRWRFRCSQVAFCFSRACCITERHPI